MKGVVGGDGHLQDANVSFMKGVRRLAGLEGKPGDADPTASLSDIAAGRVKSEPKEEEQKTGSNGNPKQKSGGNGGNPEQETSGGNTPDTKGKDGTRVSHLKDLQTMDQEKRQQTISSMSNQEMQQLVKSLDATDKQNLTQEQQQQLKNFKDQKDVDSMTREQRQMLNSIFEELAKPPKK